MNYQRKRVAKRLASGLLAGALALGGLAISGSSPVSAETPTTNRIAGVDRYDTSVALALATNATADHVVIVSGENFPDALAASGYAGKLFAAAADESVVLLTRAAALPDTVVNYLSNSANLSADAKVYIVGGTSSVSAAVETQVKAITGLTPTRVSGADRYATAVELSKKIGNSAHVILVSGTGFADGVAASGWAYATDRAVLLSGPTGLDAATKAEIKRLVTATAGLAVTIVGGTSAVPDSAISDLVGEGVKYANINRIAGADRYATATALNTVMAAAGAVGTPNVTFNASKVALVTGENYADAIAASSYLGSTATHTALVSAAGVPAGTAALVAAVAPANPTSLVAIGGYSAVGNTTLASVVSAAAAASVFTPVITVAESAAASGATATMKLKIPVAVTAGQTCAAAICVAADTVSKWLGTESNYSINGIALSNFGTGGVSVPNTGASTEFSVTITLPDGFSSAGIVVGFSGIGEGKANDNGAFSIASASATIADDATAPTFTVIRATANGTNGTAGDTTDNGTAGKVYLLASEALVGFSSADVTWANAAGTAKCGADTVTAGGAPLYVLNCFVADGGANTDGQAIAATDTVTIALDGFTDVAGNAGGAATTTQVITVAAADAVVPTLTRSSVTVTATTASEFDVSLTTGTLTLSSLAGSPMHGQGGIGWRVQLASTTGNIPSVTVDAATKRITLTANFALHTADDIINAIAQNATTKTLLSGAASAGNGGNKLNAAYIPGDLIAPDTTGTQSRSSTVIKLVASEVLSAIGNAGKFVNATCPQTATAPALAADGVTITLTCDASATPFAGLIDLGAAAATDLLLNASVATATGAGI